MRLRNAALVLLACISFSFCSFASEYDSLFKEYGIENDKDLEDALSKYWVIKEYSSTDIDLFEALYMYHLIKDEYRISDSDELEKILYTHEFGEIETEPEEKKPGILGTVFQIIFGNLITLTILGLMYQSGKSR